MEENKPEEQSSDSSTESQETTSETTPESNTDTDTSEENKEINSAAPVYTPGVSDDYIGLDGIHCGLGAIPGMYV